MVDSIWVLTKTVNQYNQEGDYFVTAFNNYPTKEELIKVTNCSEGYVTHILETGGRQDVEQEWYYITLFKFGTLYKEKEYGKGNNFTTNEN